MHYRERVHSPGQAGQLLEHEPPIPFGALHIGPRTEDTAYNDTGMHELQPLIDALGANRPRRNRLRRRLKRAAVAVILRESLQGAEVLLVERAHRPGDPWSGDMAFPGGRIEAADDASASHAACRETYEEIGLRIDRSDGVGRLSDRPTLDHRRRAPMVVSPFVYRVTDTPPLQLNHEIAAVHWLALAWLDEPDHRSHLQWPLGPFRLRMPCYNIGPEQRLWGLTLVMLDELLALSRQRP